MGFHGGEHRTLLGGYLGTGVGDYKGKERSRVDEREKETSWNCFLTKFVLPPKAKPRLSKLNWFGKNKPV